jgi:HD-like signal output (HDOD) protein
MHLPARTVVRVIERRTVEVIEDESDPLTDPKQLGPLIDDFLTRQAASLPKPPAVALEVLEMSRKRNASLEDIAALLERDALLAGHVLKLANSALYAGAAPCNTLKQALVRLGLAPTRDVVMEAAFKMTVLHAPGLEEALDVLRRHSTAVAWLSRLVARQTPMEAENAFLIGLVHDVGVSVGLLALHEALKKAKQPMALTAARWQALDDLHEAVSSKLLAHWKFGPAITLIAGSHHHLMMQGHAHPSVAVVMLAEDLATGLGWGSIPKLAEDPEGLPLMCVNGHGCGETDKARAMAALMLTQRQMDQIAAEAPEVLSKLEGQFAKPGAAREPGDAARRTTRPR